MSNRASPSPAAPSASASKPTIPGAAAIPHDKIAKRAYEKWCQRGCKHGTHQQDWLEAEAELRAEMMGQLSGRPAQAPPPMAQQASRPAQAMPAGQKAPQR
jgi:hypothetical protein